MARAELDRQGHELLNLEWTSVMQIAPVVGFFS
jgi:hypothetical protein